MILPLSREQLQTATDDEIVSAYREIGIDEHSAAVYLAVIRNPLPPGTTID